MKEPIEAATRRGVGQAALVRRMCEIILGNTFGNEELDSLALLVGHHPDVLNASTVPVSAPLPVAESEVGKLVSDLRMMASQAAEACQFGDAESLSNAADLLEQQATAYAICERERLHQSTRAADLEIERHPVPVPISERLPELRGMFERILCVARSSDQKPVGNIELADRLIKAVVSWDALTLPACTKSGDSNE